MKIYPFITEDDPNNDFIRLNIAMDANSSSTIRIFESGGEGVIQYITQSDYVYYTQRITPVTYSGVVLTEDHSDMVGYPSGLAWAPGSGISSLSDNGAISSYASISGEMIPTAWGEEEESYVSAPGPRLTPLTNKADISGARFLKSGILVPGRQYGREWNPSYIIQVENITPIYNDAPFVELKNNDVSTTGRINLYSSSLNGSIFSLDIKRDPLSGDAETGIDHSLSHKFGYVRSSSPTKRDVLGEWNSLFGINESCNAYSQFISGENRDEEFMINLGSYLSSRWYGPLQRYLWGDVINEEGLDLSTRDPEVLKNMIFYQFKYFGASDDIRILGTRQYPNYFLSYLEATVMNWHFIIKGDTTRYLTREPAYLPPIMEYKEVYKIAGQPPRTSFAYIFENNINLAQFSGSLGGVQSAPGSSY